MIFGLDVFAYNILASGQRIDVDIIWTWTEVCPTIIDWIEAEQAANSYIAVGVAANAWTDVVRTGDNEYFSVSSAQTDWTEIPPESPNTIRRC